jgi:hypothetical protein
MALMTALTRFCHLITGFDNRTLVQLMRSLHGEHYSSRQATYDLRRLRRKQIIYRIEGSHRYQLTPTGRAVAVLFTKTYGRILGPGLAALNPGLPGDLATRSPLALAWKDLGLALDRFIDHGLAAACGLTLLRPEFLSPGSGSLRGGAVSCRFAGRGRLICALNRGSWSRLVAVFPAWLAQHRVPGARCMTPSRWWRSRPRRGSGWRPGR